MDAIKSSDISVPKLNIKRNNKVNSINSANTMKKVKNYTDCFIKNSAESAPMLLGLTAIWTLVDSKTASMPLKKAAMNNLGKFFLPVLLVSSAFISFVETRNTSGKQK